MAKQTAAAKRAAEAAAKALDERPAEQSDATAAPVADKPEASPQPAPVAESAASAPTEPSAPETADRVESQNNPPASEEPPTPESVTDDDGVDGVWIRSVPESRRRCGHRFTREGVGIALEALAGEELEALQGDPELVVEFCIFSADGERQA